MKIFHLLGLVVLLLSSCDDTSGTYIISEVAFKVNNLSEQEKQKTINEFINQEVVGLLDNVNSIFPLRTVSNTS